VVTGRPVRPRVVPPSIRTGGVRLGCLFVLALAVAAVYCGAPVGDMYWRYYQFRDEFRQEARFASQHTDQDIRRHLRALADSLKLPDEADTIYVKRKGHHILIWTEYYDRVDAPFIARDSFYFNPQAEGDF
jgi:hypothetical protein